MTFCLAMFFTSTVSLCLLAVPPALSQFLSPPTGLTTENSGTYPVRYKEVPPGICEQRSDIKSISGYVDVSADQHIFFWFFEARNADPKTAPLTTWINGGPGASSMIGLFQEMGPCSIDAGGNLVDNPYSWTNVSNVLFIDQPVQTGFSYTKTTSGYISPENGSVIVVQDGVCPSDAITGGTCGTFSNPDDVSGVPVSTMAAASSFYAALQGFRGAFPQYARTGFHFATESYGGHYGPVFADYIEAQNARQGTGTTNIRLETLTIVNGWMNPVIQYPAYYNFTVSPGNTYDYSPYNSSLASELYDLVYGSGNCVDQLKHCAASGTNAVCAAADRFCFAYVENFYDAFTHRDEDDLRQLQPDPYPPETYISYLNSPTVQAAIGAFVNYTEQSLAVSIAFNTTGDDGRLDGITTDVQYLIGQGVAVTMLYGDADYNSNWLGGEAVYNSLLTNSSSSPPGYVNISTSDSTVHGQAKQTGSFAFARIYNSGHEVPYYQPLTALSIFERAITGYDIATGQTHVDDSFVTLGPAQSTYREGNGTVSGLSAQNGVATSKGAETTTGGGGEVGSGRVLAALDDSLTLVDPNAIAPHDGGGVAGLASQELKHKMKQLVHITQRKRRRDVRGSSLGDAY